MENMSQNISASLGVVSSRTGPNKNIMQENVPTTVSAEWDVKEVSLLNELILKVFSNDKSV